MIRYRHSKYLVEAIENKFGTSRNITGVEIGVWKGDNAKYLLHRFRLLELLLVDPYIAYAIDDVSEEDTHVFKKQENLDEAKRFALGQLARYGDRFSLLQVSSQQAAFECAQNLHNSSQFDFVFIDAHHSYESVKLDISCWYPLVKNGGVLCGHDYIRSDTRGVKEAVDEFVAQWSLARIRLKAHVWWVEKP